MSADYSHDAPADLADFEAVVLLDDGVIVRVSKVGGGTVGHSYRGVWHYRVEVPLEDVVQGSDFESGSKLTHAEAAEQILDLVIGEEIGYPA